jgi:hypothetical protein
MSFTKNPGRLAGSLYVLASIVGIFGLLYVPWACKDRIWMLKTTRHWLPRDLEVLKLLFETMHAEGPDFLTPSIGRLTSSVRAAGW